jgi:hypothetical protein
METEMDKSRKIELANKIAKNMGHKPTAVHIPDLDDPEIEDLEDENGWQTEEIHRDGGKSLIKLSKWVRDKLVYVLLYVFSSGFGIDDYLKQNIYIKFTPVREKISEFIDKPPFEFPKPTKNNAGKYWDFYNTVSSNGTMGTSATNRFDT